MANYPELSSYPARPLADTAPFRATLYVDPTFAGVTQTGSQSDPFASITAAIAAAVAAGYTGAEIKLPPATSTTENVVFPGTGLWEISAEAGFITSSVGARIIGNVTCNVTSGVGGYRLTNIIVTGNISGDVASGTTGLFVGTAVRQAGTITLTRTGGGTWVSFFRGLGSISPNKQGGSTTGLVSVAGIMLAENWVFEAGVAEGALSVANPYTGSQFRSCQFGATNGTAVPIGMNGVQLNTWFVDCIFLGVTTFTAASANYVVYMDGASLASLQVSSVGGAILVGTGIQLNTLNANVSAVSTVAGNVASTPYTASRSAPGLYQVDFSLTLLVAGTTGLLQPNVIYTDATGTLVTEAVGGALNIAGAVGSKARGSLQFEHNVAAAPIAFSFTGVVTPGAMSVSHISAVQRRN